MNTLKQLKKRPHIWQNFETWNQLDEA